MAENTVIDAQLSLFLFAKSLSAPFETYANAVCSRTKCVHNMLTYIRFARAYITMLSRARAFKISSPTAHVNTKGFIPPNQYADKLKQIQAERARTASHIWLRSNANLNMLPINQRAAASSSSCTHLRPGNTRISIISIRCGTRARERVRGAII